MKTAEIDMSKYVDSESIHEKCKGCDKVFDFTPEEGMITDQKCLAYAKPSIWWEDKPTAMKTEIIKTKENPKGVEVQVPVINRICPLASHVELKKTVQGTKLNPIKASKRGGGR